MRFIELAWFYQTRYKSKVIGIQNTTCWADLILQNSLQIQNNLNSKCNLLIKCKFCSIMTQNWVFWVCEESWHDFVIMFRFLRQNVMLLLEANRDTIYGQDLCNLGRTQKSWQDFDNRDTILTISGHYISFTIYFRGRLISRERNFGNQRR